MSNKRKKCIAITDIAISKVPYIKYKYIDKKYYDILNYLAKYVLYLSKSRNKSNEVAITYDLNSEFVRSNIGISFGDEHEVDPMADTNSFHILMRCISCAIVTLHNHPSTSHISLMDIVYFLDNPKIKILIMITNKGNVSYLVKKNKFNYEKAVILANESIGKAGLAKTFKAKVEASKVFMMKCSKVGVYYSNYSR